MSAAPPIKATFAASGEASSVTSMERPAFLSSPRSLMMPKFPGEGSGFLYRETDFFGGSGFAIENDHQHEVECQRG